MRNQEEIREYYQQQKGAGLLVEVILKQEIPALIGEKEATIPAGEILELDWVSPQGKRISNAIDKRI